MMSDNDKITPIDEIVSEVVDNEKNELNEEEEEEDDEECIQIDIEEEEGEDNEMDFFHIGRKSTYSIKSSTSGYDKVLKLSTLKQNTTMLLPASQSFHDNSSVSVNKYKSRDKKPQEHKNCWRGKLKLNSIKNKKHEDYKRQFFSFSTGSGVNAGNKTRRTFKFGYLYNKTVKNEQQQHQQIVDGNTEATTSNVTTKEQEKITTANKTSLGSIITSLLRTTTL